MADSFLEICRHSEVCYVSSMTQAIIIIYYMNSSNYKFEWCNMPVLSDRENAAISSIQCWSITQIYQWLFQVYKVIVDIVKELGK
jgi:hypothetical protein